MKEIFSDFFKNPDYSNIENKNKFSIQYLQELLNLIHSKLKVDKQFENDRKFARTADEIVQSEICNGCCDFALVFDKFARELGIPTVHILSAKAEWIKEMQKGKNKGYSGHHFCECYINNKWILVDPANNSIITKYDKNNLKLTMSDKTEYYVYAKCRDVFEIDDAMQKELGDNEVGQSKLKMHNKLMKKLFYDFDIDKSKNINIDVL